MFRTRNLLLAAALLAAAPAPALLAQQGTGTPAEGAEHGQHAMRSPVQTLIDHRADLGLSDDQVGRLRQIDQDLHRQMEPLHQQLEQLHAGMPGHAQGQQMSDADHQAMHQRMEQAHPLMEQVHKIHQDAMQRVSAVLTPEQREKAHQLMPHHDGGNGHGHGQNGAQSSGQGWSHGGGSR
jgi:hypothetical protein